MVGVLVGVLVGVFVEVGISVCVGVVVGVSVLGQLLYGGQPGVLVGVAVDVAVGVAVVGTVGVPAGGHEEFDEFVPHPPFLRASFTPFSAAAPKPTQTRRFAREAVQPVRGISLRLLVDATFLSNSATLSRTRLETSNTDWVVLSRILCP